MSHQPIDNNNNTITTNNSNEEMSEEARELLILKQIEKQMSKYLPPTPEELEEIDTLSVYIGNVDWHSTTKDIEEHFAECGKIVRVTIPKDKNTGRQRNFAYVEFESIASVQLALVLNGTVFRNRKVFVTAKRTNKPGMSAPSASTGGVPRGPRANQQFTQKTTKEVRVVKYVYVNGAKPTNGSRSKRFTPY